MRRTMAENILFADAAYVGPKTTGLIGRQSRMSEGQQVKPLLIDVDLQIMPYMSRTRHVQYQPVRHDVV